MGRGALQVPHFQNTPHDFQIEVASILKRQLYVPNEVIIRYGSVADNMYIVLKGIAAGKNRLFTVRAPPFPRAAGVAAPEFTRIAPEFTRIRMSSPGCNVRKRGARTLFRTPICLP